jgi:hypothetical protein
MMDESILNQILNAGILRAPAPPRTEWYLGTVDGTPSGGSAPVTIDGDTSPTDCVQAVTCADTERVLLCRQGRALIVAANLTSPAGSMTAAQILAALLTVDGTGSLLDADTCDGSHYSASDVLAKIKTVDGSGSGLDADLLDGQEGSYYAPETTTTAGSLVDGATGKTTPVDADNVAITDSAASHVLKKLTWANLKATLKTYFDTLYTPAASLTGWTDWTPTVTATGSMTISSLSWARKRWMRIGPLIYFEVNFSFTTGGTASTGVYITFHSELAALDDFVTAPVGYQDGGGTVVGVAQSYSSTAMLVRKYDGSNWGLGTNRRIRCAGFYTLAP